MNIRLHANATTTTKTRHYIQASNQSVRQLADELGVSETLSAVGNAVTALPMVLTHRTACTTLTPAQEVVVVELRKTLLLPLDDPLVATREFIHPRSSAPAWTAVYAATAFLTSRPCCPKKKAPSRR